MHPQAMLRAYLAEGRHLELVDWDCHLDDPSRSVLILTIIIFDRWSNFDRWSKSQLGLPPRRPLPVHPNFAHPNFWSLVKF